MDSPNTNVAAHYNDTVVRQFAIMSVVWGVVGMLVGVIVAAFLGAMIGKRIVKKHLAA